MADTNLTGPQQRVLSDLLHAHPQPLPVRDLATNPEEWWHAWGIVKRLKEKPKPLVKLRQATGALIGTDNSTVPVSLTSHGRTLASSL
jgi:hypothetical protein